MNYKIVILDTNYHVGSYKTNIDGLVPINLVRGTMWCSPDIYIFILRHCIDEFLIYLGGNYIGSDLNVKQVLDTLNSFWIKRDLREFLNGEDFTIKTELKYI